MAVVLGSSSYILLRKNQMKAFKMQFESLASQMKTGIILSINSTVSAGHLVNDIYSYAIQDGYVGKAPRITLPGFENIMEGINRLTQSHCIRFAPLLNESTRSSWESYAKANAKLFDGYNLNISFGIYSPGHVYDKGYVSGSPYPNLLFPVWQTSPLAKTFQGIMSNPHSILDSRGEAIDRLISTNRHQMTKILQLDLQSSLRPASAFYTPIITIGKQGKLIGISIISFFWDDVFTRSLPSFAGGIDCVISTSNQVYTFSFEDGNLTGIFKNDLHDSSLDEYKVDFNKKDEIESLLSDISQYDYTIAIYPTKSLFRLYADNVPLYVSCSTVAIILFTFLLVLTYDKLVRIRVEAMIIERTKAEAESAARDAILASKKVYVRYMSHEMRTPLNSVYMGLKLLEMDLRKRSSKDSSNNKECIETLNDITKSCDIALNILNNLLIYDKLEDRNMDLNLEKVSALTFVIESVNHMKHLAEEKNIIVLFDVDSNFIKNPYVHCRDKEIELTLNNDLKSLKNNSIQNILVKKNKFDELYVNDDDMINIDIFQMNKVITLLISNAIKYSTIGDHIIVRVRKVLTPVVLSANHIDSDVPSKRRSCKRVSVFPISCMNSDIETGSGFKSEKEENDRAQCGGGNIENIPYKSFKENKIKSNSSFSLVVEIIDKGGGITNKICENYFKDVIEFNPTNLQVCKVT